MTFEEDRSVFFSDFAVVAVWTPANGSVEQTANVILDAPDQALFDNSGRSTEYAITYDYVNLSGLAPGESITVDGVSFRVRDVFHIQDGKVMKALLARY